MIKAKYLNRECFDVRSSGDARKRVDTYYVIYDCPPDKFNPESHEWACKFEVPKGHKFVMSDFKDKKSARAECGYTI